MLSTQEPIPPTKVALREVKETCLITLYGRSLQSRWPNPILPDRWAEETVARLDYDFDRLKVGAPMASLVAARASQLDSWTRDFLAQHPESTVLHLGCGLDSRVYRVDPPATAAWFDVDFPEVIELRQGLYPARASYRMVRGSLLDLGWLAEVPKHCRTMIVAEGVFMYLSEDAIKRLLSRLTDHAGRGQLAFDAHPHQLVQKLAGRKWNVRGTGARFQWGLGTASDVSKLDPRLGLIAEQRAHKLAGMRRAPWSVRMLVRAMNVVPSLRIMRCVLCHFARA